MNFDLKQAFDTEMAIARNLYRNGQLAESFQHLEVAHVLGQRFVIPHTLSHWWMLKIGVRRRAVAEVTGQAIRIVLSIVGSTVGVVPTGNTGGTDISMFKRLPIDPAIRKLID